MAVPSGRTVDPGIARHLAPDDGTGRPGPSCSEPATSPWPLFATYGGNLHPNMRPTHSKKWPVLFTSRASVPVSNLVTPEDELMAVD